MRGYFLFICDSSSSEPSLSLLPASCSNFRFFRLLQPKAQHCVPFFPIVISTALSQLWRESGPNNMAPIKTRGLQFLLGENNRMLDPVFFLRSVVRGLFPAPSLISLILSPNVNCESFQKQYKPEAAPDCLQKIHI